MTCNTRFSLNLTIFGNKTNFTTDQLIDYFDRYHDLSCLDDSIRRVQRISLIVSGLIGFFTYLLTVFVLRQVVIRPCTLVYHASMTIIELFHMIIMTQYGVLRLFESDLPSSAALAYWNYLTYDGYYIGDAIKLAVSTLTAFLSFERMVAVCIPALFAKTNRKLAAYFAVFLSLLIGSAHLWAIFTWRVEYDEKTHRYIGSPTAFSKSALYQFSIDFIYISKIALSLLIFILCVATATGLIAEAKRTERMARQHKAEWIVKRRLCVFSIIIGICTLLDHVVWVAYKAMTNRSSGPIGDKAVYQSSFQDAMNDLSYSHLVVSMSLVQALMGELVHSYRFFIYFALNKTMRDGLTRLSLRRKSNKVGEGRIVLKNFA